MKISAIFLIVCFGLLQVPPSKTQDIQEMIKTCKMDKKAMTSFEIKMNDLNKKLISQREKRIRELEKNLANLIKKESKKLSQSVAKHAKATGPCPSPWMFARKDLCVLIPTLQLNWNDSQAYCKKMGGSLIVFKKNIDYTAVKRLVPQVSQCPWIGLRQVKGQKVFITVSGSTNFLKKWAANEPNFKDHLNRSMNEMCVTLCRRGMRDQPCIYEGIFICEKSNAKLNLS